jgi:hypothetical protein
MHHPRFSNKSFVGVQGGTYSAVLRNAHGDGTSFEALYVVLALQMLPHAVGFSKESPGRRRQKKVFLEFL